MNMSAEKNEIIKWVQSLENPVLIGEINKIRKRTSFDFEKEWIEGISISEARKKTSDFIKSLDWKK
ncbi:hypothetical protein [Chryseobacterium sp. FH1]|uniref:hypothetical protein n=1 Tax=Chryseobacterium sp. FH1 TaxID=1233951 RepID=UPI0004E45E4F|nr:hypothetical protein [Chryseobacterium sp. FH1]KFC18662.1 hypothetical protein IO90_16805 [Chryseobacterium sp. FH1]